MERAGFILAVVGVIVLLGLFAIALAAMAGSTVDEDISTAAAERLSAGAHGSWDGVERRAGVDRRWYQPADVPLERRVGGRRLSDPPDAREHVAV